MTYNTRGQSFLWSVTFGGYGLGLARDFVSIPRYVREASGGVEVRFLLHVRT